jgi:hypothetical protein
VARKEYNEERPHSSLGYKTPKEFAQAQVAGFSTDEREARDSNGGCYETGQQSWQKIAFTLRIFPFVTSALSNDARSDGKSIAELTAA